MIQSELQPYINYVYSYPHKTSYRPFDPPIPLDQIWENEERNRLFLYLHIPFCSQRCGYCNLFSRVAPSVPESYLDAIERQSRVFAKIISPKSISRIALGGGTPSILTLNQFIRVFDILEILGASPLNTPCSIEVSPETATDERLFFLREKKVARISLGIQSFQTVEAQAVNRPCPSNLQEICRNISRYSFQNFNIDLITGLPGQNVDSLRKSIDTACDVGANEIYLYPLYIRPLTNCGMRGLQPEDRFSLQQAGRDHLLHLGWKQSSLRRFLAPGYSDEGPQYRCQDDGMIGLGCGARSYTKRIHYSDDFAVSNKNIARIIDRWSMNSEEYFSFAHNGIQLEDDDIRRRWLILSLLEAGVDTQKYSRLFFRDCRNDFPELSNLCQNDLANEKNDIISLTPKGYNYSDSIGPRLFSNRVKNLMKEWQPQ